MAPSASIAFSRTRGSGSDFARSASSFCRPAIRYASMTASLTSGGVEASRAIDASAAMSSASPAMPSVFTASRRSSIGCPVLAMRTRISRARGDGALREHEERTLLDTRRGASRQELLEHGHGLLGFDLHQAVQGVELQLFVLGVGLDARVPCRRESRAPRPWHRRPTRSSDTWTEAASRIRARPSSVSASSRRTPSSRARRRPRPRFLRRSSRRSPRRRPMPDRRWRAALRDTPRCAFRPSPAGREQKAREQQECELRSKTAHESSFKLLRAILTLKRRSAFSIRSWRRGDRETPAIRQAASATARARRATAATRFCPARWAARR